MAVDDRSKTCTNRLAEFEGLFERCGFPDDVKTEKRMLLEQRLEETCEREYERLENEVAEMDREAVNYYSEVQRLRGLLEMEPFSINESCKIFQKREVLYKEQKALREEYDSRYQEQCDLLERYEMLARVRLMPEEIADLIPPKEDILLTLFRTNQIKEQLARLEVEIEERSRHLTEMQTAAKKLMSVLFPDKGFTDDFLWFTSKSLHNKLNDHDMKEYNKAMTKLHSLHKEKFHDEIEEFERIQQEISDLADACAIPESERKNYSRPVYTVSCGLYGNGTIEFINLDDYEKVKGDFENLKLIYKERSEAIGLYKKWLDLWDEMNRLETEATTDKKHYAKGKAQLDAFAKRQDSVHKQLRETKSNLEEACAAYKAKHDKELTLLNGSTPLESINELLIKNRENRESRREKKLSMTPKRVQTARMY
ncbi:hypothetical protein QR680_018671 [Steinernema hermaphroditum]|uniref:Uncharacterized protein n=1 Tax=Steinernema hermaphroditum TaxID=289476 RepID=A0AA39HL02_9BILA|nr:hypothetical protein QR680_018671 [Steinernema hermaphroditum]